MAGVLLKPMPFRANTGSASPMNLLLGNHTTACRRARFHSWRCSSRIGCPHRGGRGLRSMETCASAGEAEGGYKRPPKEISDIIDSPAQPLLSIAPNRQRIMQLPRPPPYPPVQELARPELKLAGVRIDADIWARSRGGYYTDITFTDLETVVPTEDEGAVVRLKGLPDGNWWISLASWAPDSQHVAFSIRSPGGPQDSPRQPHELWVASPYTGAARCLLASPSQGLNTVFESYEWVDDDTLVATVLPDGVAELPQKPATPPGPRVQDNSTGRTAQNRTYQDLLKTQHDEDLFEYYGTSELVQVTLSTGDVKRIGLAQMYTAVAPSPDGQYLLVRWLERPFSFAVPCGRFPAVVQVWTRDGEFVREVARFPLAEDIPIAFNSVRDGPRSVGWRDDKPAELHWIEPQDGGDAGRSASPRDIVYTLDLQAGDAAAPQELARTDNRCGGVAWCDDDLALVYESWWKSRRSIISMVAPGDRARPAEVLFDRSYEDVYNDPGSPASRRTPLGTHVIAKMGGRRELLMQGMGASPQGNRPFLDVLDLDTRETHRIWQSSEPFYESTSSILSDLDGKDVELEGLQMLSMRESVRDPPQFYLKTFRADGSFEERCMTDYPHPYPSIRDLQKELIRYERSDGVHLTGTLYLPPGYDQEKEGPLPCLLWAYPREYKSKEAAGQLRRSPYEFSGISGTSPLLWLARRYAVLSGPSMPIIAEGDEEPNDTYISQLTSSAQAAVEELERRGVAERGRVVVGGHSYGAFMTANLLAHTGDLFAAGIAMSGAYNRTLTPFGFQAEERTLWQATDTYINMSPYLQADKIKRPMLLVHGEDDTNPGTFTLQSERMYSALQGHGGTCRLVVLPHESHSYRAYESVMHALYEMDAWITHYCGHSS